MTVTWNWVGTGNELNYRTMMEDHSQHFVALEAVPPRNMLPPAIMCFVKEGLRMIWSKVTTHDNTLELEGNECRVKVVFTIDSPSEFIISWSSRIRNIELLQNEPNKHLNDMSDMQISRIQEFLDDHVVVNICITLEHYMSHIH